MGSALSSLPGSVSKRKKKRRWLGVDASVDARVVMFCPGLIKW